MHKNGEITTADLKVVTYTDIISIFPFASLQIHTAWANYPKTSRDPCCC
jgi:hypothetical protein